MPPIGGSTQPRSQGSQELDNAAFLLTGVAKHEEHGKVESLRLGVIRVGPYFEGALLHE